MKWLQFIINKLVSSNNLTNTISNSDLELTGGLLHLKTLVQCFGIWECINFNKTDNLMCW